MNFSPEWDRRYLENTHMAVWPWSDLVSLVRRHCGALAGARVLELGCGAGANIPFFRAMNAQYFAVDGSPTMVGRLRERFPDLAANLAVGDFTVEQPFAPPFDLIVDRAALTHNTTAAIESALRLARSAMKPGACIIGVDWFSTHFSEFLRGEPAEDAYTRKGYRQGPFADTGRVHFSDAAHLRELFGDFELLLLEEKRTRSHVPADAPQFAAWNLVARKPDD